MNIIEFLSGKKTTIATILGAILVYVQGRGYIQEDTAILFCNYGCSSLTANVATGMYYKRLVEENIKHTKISYT